MTLALIVLLGVLASVESAEAACTSTGANTWLAGGLDDEHFMECNAAATAGDTVNFPSGTGTWNADFTITKKLIMIGSGCTLDADDRPTSCTSQITINDGGPMDVAMSLGLTNSSVSYFSITTANLTGTTAAFIMSNGVDATARIHHNLFVNDVGVNNNRRCVFMNGSEANGLPRALIDHNTFMRCRVSIYANGGGKAEGYWTWESAHEMGQFNHPIVENNTFDYTTYTQGNCLEVDRGASATFRFNDVAECPVEAHTLASGGSASGRILEVYGNTWSACFGNMGIFYRGGGGIAFSNTFPAGDCSFPIIVDNSARSATAGQCDGSNALDGNLGSGSTYPAAGWPCFNQTGFGIYDGAFDEATHPGMSKQPVPMFLNRKNGVRVTWAASSSSDEHIANCHELQIEDDDIATWDGVCGTGVGTRAQMDGIATCTPTVEESGGSPGTASVFFWVTDEGEWNDTNGATADGRLYRCQSDGSGWDLFYTPLAYPAAEGDGDPEPPASSGPVRLRLRGDLNQ
jgi:hypothetical protein